MKFLANENFPLKSIVLLRENGYPVYAVLEETPGALDSEIMALANREKFTILTFDRDYGELIYKLKLPVPAGVVYFRFAPETPMEPAELLLQILQSIPIINKFTVIERDRIRQRPLFQLIENDERPL